jgi:hypothetical protein
MTHTCCSACRPGGDRTSLPTTDMDGLPFQCACPGANGDCEACNASQYLCDGCTRHGLVGTLEGFGLCARCYAYVDATARLLAGGHDPIAAPHAAVMAHPFSPDRAMGGGFTPGEYANQIRDERLEPHEPEFWLED